MTYWLIFILFLITNFAALALGAYFQGEGPSSIWYQNLNIAPWTPPGWVFGAAWTTIMVCFSFYMATLVKHENLNLVVTLFVIQFILNVSWTPVFFNYHEIGFALILICALLVLVGFFTFYYFSFLKVTTLFILPYFIWLCIATSLNVWALIKN